MCVKMVAGPEEYNLRVYERTAEGCHCYGNELLRYIKCRGYVLSS
jgi:hypothetical protein